LGQVGHEVEEHEAGKDQQGLRPIGEVGGQGRQKQTCGTAEEAENLERNSAYDVGQQNCEYDADDQQSLRLF